MVVSKRYLIVATDEGCRLQPYFDDNGFLTIGYGFLITKEKVNLSSVCFELTKTAADDMLPKYVDDRINSAINYPLVGKAWVLCNETRRAVLSSIAYQIGPRGLSKFVNMLTAIINQDWQRAHDHCLDSNVARTYVSRWTRNANMLLTGELDPYYDNRNS